MEYKKICEITSVVTGGTPSTSVDEYWAGGSIPWLQSGCCQNCDVNEAEKFITQAGYDNSSARLMPKDTVMIALTGATAGKLGYLNFEACGNQSITGILPCDLLNQKFLFYYLISKRPQILSDCVGGAQAHISQGYVKNIHVPMCPLAVQEKIVKILDKTMEIIVSRKRELEELDNLIKSRFVELFGSMESKIPISEMCNVTGGYSFKSGDISNDGAIKILQIGNVYLDNVSWETTNYLPEGFDEKYSKFMLDEGDIVVALTRPIIQSLGNVKACIVKSSDLPCLLNQRVGRIVAKKEKSVFLEFIYGCLMTDDFTRYVESCSIGCSQPNISTKDIENYLIPNATYEEQKAYVEFKKQTDKSKFEVQKSLEETQILMDALMQKYFG